MALSQVSRRILCTSPLRVSRFCTLRSGVDRQITHVAQRSGTIRRHSTSQEAFDLPTAKAMKNVPQQGWKFDTEVSLSNVPRAGNGRFAKEFVKAQSSLIEKPLVPMATIDSLLSIPNDVTITFANVADLEKYIDLCKAEGGQSRETVLELFEEFIFGLDGHHACLNVATWAANHSDSIAHGLNVNVVEKTLPDGGKAYVGEAITDIKVDDELFMDYRMFKLPKWYYAFANENDFLEMGTVPETYRPRTGVKKLSGSKWSEFTVERWRSAVYINMSYFGDLYTDTINFVEDISKHMKLRGERVSLIEVGCGTGEFIRPIMDNFQVCVGVDFNPAFIEFCNEHIPKGKEDKAKFVTGDATELVKLMQDTAPEHIWSDTRIVTCVGNTIGIIPEELKPKVYQQMAELAGPKGVVVMVYWNAKWFGDACQNFYFANPQLCGPFDGSAVDMATTTLTTPPPVNYRSHWTGIDEARSVLKEMGLEEIIVEEKGKGVLVAARLPQSS